MGAATLLHPAFSVTVDVDRALVYAVFAGPEPDVFYGGERAAADPYANAVVALDARTGAPRWHFQTVRHDVWDYDLLAPPVLLEAAIDGERVPVLALAGSRGLPLCARSQDRRAGVRARRGAGTVFGRARREHVAGAARAAEAAADRARQLCSRRSRHGYRYDGGARGVLSCVARSQRRLAEHGTVHAVSAPRAGRGAALDDRVPGIARRRELGRRGRRSDRKASCSSTRAARAVSVGSSATPPTRRRLRPDRVRASIGCRTGARAPSAGRSRASGGTTRRRIPRATSKAGAPRHGRARSRRGARSWPSTSRRARSSGGCRSGSRNNYPKAGGARAG